MACIAQSVCSPIERMTSHARLKFISSTCRWDATNVHLDIIFVTLPMDIIVAP